MKKSMVGLGLFVAATLSLARDASADERQDTDALLVAGFGAMDLGFIASDLAAGAQEKWRSRGYGGLETVAAGAQVAICLDKALSAGLRPTGEWQIGAGFGAILLAHGLVTLLAPRSHTEGPPPPGSFTVAPLALGDVARSPLPGLALLGRF
jgi:hypothetical protein